MMDYPARETPRVVRRIVVVVDRAIPPGDVVTYTGHGDAIFVAKGTEPTPEDVAAALRSHARPKGLHPAWNPSHREIL